VAHDLEAGREKAVFCCSIEEALLEKGRLREKQNSKFGSRGGSTVFFMKRCHGRGGVAEGEKVRNGTRQNT